MQTRTFADRALPIAPISREAPVCLETAYDKEQGGPATVVSTLNILLVEDNPADVRLVQEMLGFAYAPLFLLTTVDCLAAAFARVSETRPDLILLDLSLPDSQGLETFLRVQSRAPDIPIVVLSGSSDEWVAIEAVHQGAQDYLVKGKLDDGLLVRAVRYAIERHRTEEQLRHSERFAYSIFNALSLHIAILDETGRILAANTAWHDFMRANAGNLEFIEAQCGVGDNYLAACDASSGSSSEGAKHCANGIREVMSGAVKEYTFEYPYHTQSQKYWFVCRITRFQGEGPVRLVVLFSNITALKEADENWRESAERLQLATAAGELAVWEYDIRSQALTWDERMMTLYAFTPETFSGAYHAWSIRLHPEDRARAEAEFQDTISHGKRFDTEFRIVQPDGTILFIKANAAVLNDENGIPYRVIGLNQNITERKLAEDMKARLAAIVESCEDAIISSTLDGVISSWNTGAEHLYGYSASEAIGQSFSILIPQGQADDLPTILARIGKGERIQYFETVRRRKDGSLVPVSLSIFPLRDRNGRIIASSAIARDITERKRAEQKIVSAHAEALRARDEIEEKNTQLQEAIENAKRLYAVVEKESLTKSVMLAAIPSIFISVDAENRIVQWNTAAEASFGIAAHNVLGKSFNECGIQWSWPAVMESIDACNLSGKAVRLDNFRFTRPEGAEGMLGLTLTPVYASDQQQTGFLIVGADITERKLMESQLAHAQKMESIGHLSAGIAHEINTPTQYIGDNTRFLREAFQDLSLLLTETRELVAASKAGTVPAELVARVKVAIEQADVDYLMEEIPRAIQESLDGIARVTKIVQAMKDFSHPGTAEKVAVDINRAIESTLAVARNEWKYVAEVITEFDPNLPLVPCLPDEFNQVILNLVINAVHAIAEVLNKANHEDKTHKGVITLRTCLAGDWVEVHIVDTGPGIPESIRNRVFDPFFTTKEVGKGTGQGLAIAHSIMVDKHGGTIHFETEMGRGTTFILRLPLVEAPQRESTKTE